MISLFRSRSVASQSPALFENLEQRALLAADLTPASFASPAFASPATIIDQASRTDLASPLALSAQLPPDVANLAARGVAGVPGNRATFTDADGDIVTIRLSGPGILIINPGGTTAYGVIETANSTDRSSLSISVSRRTGGDGFANIDSITGAALRSLSAARVNLLGTGVDGGGINFTGFVNALSLRDIRNGADINIGGDQTRTGSFSARAVNFEQATATSVITYGDIKSSDRPVLSSFTLRYALNTVVNAGAIRSFRALANSRDNVDGTINNVDLNLSNTIARGFILNSATVQGVLSNSEWIISRGGIGSVNARTCDNFELQILGQNERNISLNSLVVRDALEFAVSTLGAVRNMSLWSWDGGSLAATQVNSLKVIGSRSFDNAGDMRATIGFTNPTSTVLLNSLFVRGNFSGLIASSRSLGDLSFGSLTNATINAGATRSDFASTGGLPASTTGLFTGTDGNIRSITLRLDSGASLPNLADSYIVARTITSLNIDTRGADFTNGDQPFGVATTLVSSLRIRGENTTFSARNVNYDFFSTPRGIITNTTTNFVDTSGPGQSITDLRLRIYSVA
jgi:hypothetical protein